MGRFVLLSVGLFGLTGLNGCAPYHNEMFHQADQGMAKVNAEGSESASSGQGSGKRSKRFWDTPDGASLLLDCHPDDAEVVLDAMPYALCKDLVDRPVSLAKGMRHVEVRKIGFVGYETWLDPDGTQANLHVTLVSR